MKRRYLRVRVVAGVVPEAAKVVLLDSGRNIAGQIPVRYAPALCAAAGVGGRVRASIFPEWPPRLGGHRLSRRLRLERVCFRVVP